MITLPKSVMSLRRFQEEGGLVREGVLPLTTSARLASIGTWYIQLILMAQQTGMFTGSALLPIRPLRFPRTTLLAAALAYMAVFVTAFMMALKLRAGPVAFVPLCYALTTCQG
eukprot:jgi/Sobl393_1/3904/SZX76583.1